MKIAFPYNSWRGGFLKSIEKAFKNLGHETLFCQRYNPSIINKILRRVNSFNISQRANVIKNIEYNEDFFNQLEIFQPDYFFNLSGSNLFPETIKKIREELRCATICLIADNPCDPAPQRDKYFPMTLRYYDILLNPEPLWDNIINNLSSNSKIIPFYGGYDPDLFFPVNNDNISDKNVQRFSADVSFTGNSYGESPEGAYRAGILGLLEEFDVKIWGDKGWQFRFPYYPKLKEAYQGERLNYEDLLKLYKISTINLNIPSPQIVSGFQPRVFEIAAAKGFQIVDHSDDFYHIFNKDEIVTFKSFADLKEKIKFYLNHDKKRNEIDNKMYKRVVKDYTWDKQIEKAFKKYF